MSLLTNDEILVLEDAVQKAESKTSGEIATAIIQESDSYIGFELNFALLKGFFFFFIMLFFTPEVKSVLEGMFWDYSDSYLVMFYGFSTFLVIFITYFMFNLPFFDRLIVPKKVMAEKVKNRAIRHFIEAGVINTKERTGILIFISVLERKVELIADEGIASKIEPEKWQEIVDTITKGIKEKNIVENFSASIAMCGELLSEHFPKEEGNPNELNDTITILEQ